MGLFSNKKIKPGKDYSMAEAMKILSQKGYEAYTTKPSRTNLGKVEIITIAESRELESKIRQSSNNRKEFLNELNNGGMYRNVGKKQYNNYQNVKGYRQSQNIYKGKEDMLDLS